MPSFDDLLAKTNLPEPALAPLKKAVSDYVAMVNKSNGLVASINAAKAQDPNNVDYLDKLWRAKESDSAIAEKVAEFDAIAEQYERLLKELRDHAKGNYIPAQLSEDDAKNARKQVNESAPAISEARKSIAAQLTLVESVLSALGVEIPEGGMVTLLPQADSLKNARGRKAATAAGEVKTYLTRVGDVLIDGKSTQVNGKGNFRFAAAQLSEKWNSKLMPENEVTGEEIEEAYFASMGKENRSLKSTEIPESHTFEFTKTILVQNPNDDSKTEVPQTVKLTVISQQSTKSDTTENAPAETSEPKTEKSEPAKVEAATNSAPAKKAPAQPKK
jgi:hypothetical protein